MKSVMNHSFSKAPTADIPRSQFDRSHGYKTTFDAGYLIPIFLDEALPGDTLSLNPTLFARMSTPINPIIDNIFLDVHFFSVPYRQVWDNFRKFCGEQRNPNDSTDYLVPMITVNTAYTNQSLYDYLGLPTGVTGYKHSALPLRAYNHIYNEWYRDQNLVNSRTLTTSDTDTHHYALQRRGKRHDYFTSCLPWLQKGDSVDLPLGNTAPVTSGLSLDVRTDANTGGFPGVYSDSANAYKTLEKSNSSNAILLDDTNYSSFPNKLHVDVPNLQADLSTATASTINELRQAFQIQKLLERDARSGTRYSEIVKSHFGVDFLDVTYRPEFLGGTSTPVQVMSVPSTNDGTRKLGDLGSYATATSKGGGFTKSFTEHCVVMGIASVRADLTYQQGLDRMWSRSTRYDFYWPALAHIGEQAVLSKEIYCDGSANDDDVFGYQERWAEYRYKQSRITGKMRSNDSQSLDAWHLSQEFSTRPGLNKTFIEENPPMSRIQAVTTEPDFILDAYFDYKCARPMPIHSVPGLIDHF